MHTRSIYVQAFSLSQLWIDNKNNNNTAMELDKLRYNWIDVEDDIRLYASSLGICSRRIPMDDRRSMCCLPVTVFPSPMERSTFQLAINLQPSINEMIHKISINHQFLEQSLLKLPDEFVAKLFHIYQTVSKQGYAASHQLGIFRSDYMIDQHSNLKQVEVNTISTGFCALTQQVTQLHRYTLKHYQGLSDDQINGHIATNDSLDRVAQSLIDAHRIYSRTDQHSAILFVVQEQEANVMDQKMIEWKMKSLSPDIRIYRRSFRDLDHGIISLGPNQQLLLTTIDKTQVEISVVYFRAAYSSSCFGYENSWKLRLLLEQSRAIKCPSIQLQLAGVKQFQTLLSDRAIFDRFCCSSSPHSDKLFNTYTKFWNISQSARDLVIKNPSEFVLKSNQEGGGNNVFGEQIIDKLDRILSNNENDAYFLMQFIRQKAIKSLLIFKQPPPSSATTSVACQPPPYNQIDSELGIYGSVLVETNGHHIVWNQNAGHLLRSKLSGEKEAGVFSGAGILDTPFLI